MTAVEAPYFDLKSAVIQSEAKVLSGYEVAAGAGPIVWKMIRLAFTYGKTLRAINALVERSRAAVEKAEQKIVPGHGFDPEFEVLVKDLRNLLNYLQTFYDTVRGSSLDGAFRYQLRLHQALMNNLSALIKRFESKLALDRAYQELFSEDPSATRKAEDDLIAAIFGAESVAQDSLR